MSVRNTVDVKSVLLYCMLVSSLVATRLVLPLGELTRELSDLELRSKPDLEA